MTKYKIRWRCRRCNTTITVVTASKSEKPSGGLCKKVPVGSGSTNGREHQWERETVMQIETTEKSSTKTTSRDELLTIMAKLK